MIAWCYTILVHCVLSIGYADCKVCSGERKKLNTFFANYSVKLQHYRDTYANCTKIMNNVELKMFEMEQNPDDLSFLDTIEEVRGYVLVFSNDITRFSMKNLKLIRGLELYNGKSVYIAANNKLKKVLFPQLRDIQNGNVNFENNPHLCFAKGIKWGDIASKETVINFENSDGQNCSPCNQSSCDTCWDEETCQTLFKLSCKRPCPSGCLIDQKDTCCHEECMAGCSQEGPQNCERCKHYNNSGECVYVCPEPKRYNRQTMNLDPVEGGKYTFEDDCVESCPGLTVSHNYKCISNCPEGFHAEDGVECTQCSDASCPKVCTISTTLQDYNKTMLDGLVNCSIVNGDIKISKQSYPNKLAGRLEELFSEITVINGVLWVQGTPEEITDLSFFKNLKTIKGQKGGNSNSVGLLVLATSLKSLNFPSLESVENGGMHIIGNNLLSNIGLMKLKKIKSIQDKAVMVIQKNPNLCHVSEDLFKDLIAESGNKVTTIADNGKNCEISCHKECDGLCWANDDSKYCKTCRNFNFEGECVESCDGIGNVFVRGKECIRCHPQCSGGCSDEGPDKCLRCLNAVENNICVEFCPPLKYRDTISKQCKPCHQVCKDGCSGASPSLGRGGCNSCHLFFVQDQICLGKENFGISCEDGYFRKFIPNNYTDNSGTIVTESIVACSKCDDMCARCSGENTRSISNLKLGQCECKFGEYQGMCVESCPQGTYLNETSKECLDCHVQCSQCYGAGDDECTICKNSRYYFTLDIERDHKRNDIDVDDDDSLVKLGGGNSSQGDEKRSKRNIKYNIKSREAMDADTKYRDKRDAGIDADPAVETDHDYNREKFQCVDMCPFHLSNPNEIVLNDGTRHKICEKENRQETSILGRQNLKSKIIVGSVVTGIIFLIGILVIIVAVLRKQRARLETNKMKLQAKIEGLVTEEILMPTKAQPDLSLLKLINESELKRGPEIGSGAFGTVYKGIWRPENTHFKVAVAIKVLIETSTVNQQTELLDEARVMASVSHPCCIRILAVCMAKQMMLVTPLIENGSLLEFIRKNKADSLTLMKWATQIARGMNYLEEKGIVHRDLAARNILVHNNNQVKITDFGLAKLLNCEEHFLSTGGKMPIKWLALESIEHHIFTHKSDVWSYGVTLWELFTYGERPYENIRAVDIAKHLEMGERLPQPAICTIDVYMVMVKCWLVYAEGRPSFAELENEFSLMSKDPGRYLVIPGDKFLRLPSNPMEDRRYEFLKQMQLNSVDAMNIISGDDYYDMEKGGDDNSAGQGKHVGGSKKKLIRLSNLREERDTTISNEYINTSPTSLEPPSFSPSSPTAAKPQQQQQQLNNLGFSNLEAALSRNKGKKDSIRYLSTPMDGGEHDDDDGDGAYVDPFNLGQAPRPPSIDEIALAKIEHEYMNKNSDKFDLKPMIEDYLDPTVKKTADTATDQSEYVGNSYMEMKSPVVAIDNPEYMQHQQNSGNVPAAREIAEYKNLKKPTQNVGIFSGKLMKSEATDNYIVADGNDDIKIQSYNKLRN